MGTHYIPPTVPLTASRRSPSIVSRAHDSSTRHVHDSSTHHVEISSTRQVEIMTALDMDQGLVGAKGSRTSLETSWKRYTTITKAISNVGGYDWDRGKKPSDGEIIGVYSGKSAFYDQSKVLQHVRLHPNMIEWLERDLNVDDIGDEVSIVWGYYKSAYTLKDLEKWLERKQREARSDVKGKKKASVQPHNQSLRSQKGKGDDEGDDSTSPSVKKTHKKSVGGRK